MCLLSLFGIQLEINERSTKKFLCFRSGYETGYLKLEEKKKEIFLVSILAALAGEACR